LPVSALCTILRASEPFQRVNLIFLQLATRQLPAHLVLSWPPAGPTHCARKFRWTVSGGNFRVRSRAAVLSARKRFQGVRRRNLSLRNSQGGASERLRPTDLMLRSRAEARRLEAYSSSRRRQCHGSVLRDAPSALLRDEGLGVTSLRPFATRKDVRPLLYINYVLLYSLRRQAARRAPVVKSKTLIYAKPSR
jgi:hypothetical protein